MGAVDRHYLGSQWRADLNVKTQFTAGRVSLLGAGVDLSMDYQGVRAHYRRVSLNNRASHSSWHADRKSNGVFDADGSDESFRVSLLERLDGDDTEVRRSIEGVDCHRSFCTSGCMIWGTPDALGDARPRIVGAIRAPPQPFASYYSFARWHRTYPSPFAWSCTSEEASPENRWFGTTGWVEPHLRRERPDGTSEHDLVSELPKTVPISWYVSRECAAVCSYSFCRCRTVVPRARRPASHL